MLSLCWATIEANREELVPEAAWALKTRSRLRLLLELMFGKERELCVSANTCYISAKCSGRAVCLVARVPSTLASLMCEVITKLGWWAVAQS